jgi:flavin-dependent dehydrogenase
VETAGREFDYDVVVFGGAVAGSSTAILLRRRREDRPIRLESR